MTVTAVGSVQDALVALSTSAEWSALLLDLLLPDGSGLDVLRAFRARDKIAPAMVLTGYTEASAVNAAYDCEADYVVKPIDAPRILRFVRSTLLADVHRLSDRERQVLRSLAGGHEPKAIAFQLGLADSTVRVLLLRVKVKLRIARRSRLVEWARLLDLP